MAGWFRGKRGPAQSLSLQMRGLAFGDVPLAAWGPRDGEASGGPWQAFAEAGNASAGGDNARAIAILKEIAALPDLESRHYLVAWSALRGLGCDPPPEVSKVLYGVVIEVGMDGGLDLLAAYADLTARYWNHANAAVIWDRPTGQLDGSITRVLRAASALVQRIGPWEGPRPEPPPAGHMRLNFLTPGGLHFGQGPLAALATDALAGPLVAAGTELLRAMTQLPMNGQ